MSTTTSTTELTLSHALPSRRSLGAALLLGSVALLVLGVQPIVFGAMLEGGVISLPGVGIAAMGEIIMIGLGVALGDALVPLDWQRRVAVIAALLTAAVDVGTTLAAADGGLIALRAVAGLGEGALVWVATITIVRAARPERVTAIFMVMQAGTQICLSMVLAAWILPQSSWKGGFWALALLLVLVAPLAVSLPDRLHATHASATARLRFTPAHLLPLLIAFLNLAAAGALWAYLEPLAQHAGLDEAAARAATSVALCLQIVGGLAAYVAVRRLAPWLALLGGGVVLGAVSIWLGLRLPRPEMSFYLASAVFGFGWMFVMPFQVALALRADRQGRVAVLIPAAQLLGSACGPLLASLLLHDRDPLVVTELAGGLAAGAVMLAAWSSRHREHAVALEAGR